ncbi:MAG: hypothetical protein LBB68_05905 [Treponema sp.]|jgi:hypothetical protein|nr:hypothetical protein [Treponema sp.]
MFSVLMIGALLFSSCAAENAPDFPFFSESPAGAGEIPRALSKKSIPGTLTLGKNQTLEYAFKAPLNLASDYSLEVEYGFCPKGAEDVLVPDPALIREFGARGQLILKAGGVAWILPLDASFLGMDRQAARIRYVLPVSSLEKISVSWVSFPKEINKARLPKIADTLTLKILGLGLVKRWYGLSLEETRFSATPFVSAPDMVRPDGLLLPSSLVVEPPDNWQIPGGVELVAESLSGNTITAETGSLHFERFAANGRPGRLFIPAGSLPAEPWPFSVKSEGGIVSLRMYPAPERPFPGEPIPADPGLILDYPQEAWRNSRYEVFRWDDFPSILIFDFADYATQDRYLKRLAFYVEKAGFRGRLAEDREIVNLHGWNAHDYRSQDLSAFFEAARIANFPLLPEERELEALLIKTGILKRGGDGALRTGEGAIISISRQSEDYLRFQLLTHEGFHGLFFIDEDFRNFSRLRWENLSPTAKRFILALFASFAYDTGDTGLMINELMAYCLQQPVSQAPRYFGEIQAGRLEAISFRRSALPPKDAATESWPEIANAFRAEAAAFSAYVDRRWGLAAGRVRQVRVRNLSGQ